MLRMRTDIAAASADAIASPAALRLRQPPQEAANLYSIHASVIDHALPRIASHRRASPARPAGFHGTQHAPQPPRRTQRTYVYILLRPSPRAHIHTRTRLALAQSRTSSTCASSCHWTELRAMPVSQQCCAPFSLCRHLPSSHNRRAHSRYARDSLSHVESCRARARARGWWLPRCLAASLPRSLTRYCTRSRSSSGTRSERGPLNGLRPSSGPNVPPPRCVRRLPCACAAPLDPLPMSDELSNNRPAARPTRHAAAALSLRPPRCVPRPLTGLAC